MYMYFLVIICQRQHVNLFKIRNLHSQVRQCDGFILKSFTLYVLNWFRIGIDPMDEQLLGFKALILTLQLNFK